MGIEIASSYASVEEDCLTPIDVTIRDDKRSERCRYYVFFAFNSANDANGDVAGKKFPILPDLPHRFWVKPDSVGAISIWALKECEEGGETTALLPEFPPVEYAEANWEELREMIQSTADTGFVITDLRVISLPIKDCDNFEAKAAALGIGFGAGVGAGGVAATLLTALGGTAGAGGLLGAAGAITGAGILSATGIGLIILVVVALAMWLILRKDCCELGVDPSAKGKQGSPVFPFSPR